MVVRRPSKWAIFTVGLAALSLPFATPAWAEEVTGKILNTQGHESSACRMVKLRRSDNGTDMWFRIPAGNTDILAITMTALASRLTVTISYDPGITSGCGAEPKISWIALLSDVQ